MMKVVMRQTLLAVRAEVTDPMMRMALDLAVSLVVTNLSVERRGWLTSMLRDMAYDCDCRGQSGYADDLRNVASVIYADSWRCAAKSL